MAVANYRTTFGCYPPAYIADRDGRPMHSWRVLILPFLEQQNLYAAYHFDEPWDGPNNRMLAGRIERVFRRSGLEDEQSETTSFVAVVGPETAWPGTRAVTDKEISDDHENTITIVEVPDGLFRWMEPKDLEFDRMSFRINDGSGRGLGSRLGGARVLTADCMIRTLHDDCEPNRLRAMLTINGGEKIGE